MITPKVAVEQGSEIDSFLDKTIKQNAGYVECTECGIVHESSTFTPEILSKWRFSLMGLIPSRFFRTVRGICPICQENRKIFKGVLSR